MTSGILPHFICSAFRMYTPVFEVSRAVTCQASAMLAYAITVDTWSFHKQCMQMETFRLFHVQTYGFEPGFDLNGI